MYEYIKGLLVEATPAYAVIECGGVGYYINISVNTYSQIVALQQVSLYIHQIVREDALLLYGFFNKECEGNRAEDGPAGDYRIER